MSEILQDQRDENTEKLGQKNHRYKIGIGLFQKKETNRGGRGCGISRVSRK